MDLPTGLFYCAFTCVLYVYLYTFADGKLNHLLQRQWKKYVRGAQVLGLWFLICGKYFLFWFGNSRDFFCNLSFVFFSRYGNKHLWTYTEYHILGYFTFTFYFLFIQYNSIVKFRTRKDLDKSSTILRQLKIF